MIAAMSDPVYCYPIAKRIHWLVVGLTCLLVSHTALGVNFSQYTGFKEYFARFPPRHELPASHERKLLARYMPRFYRAPDHALPVDFYRDYIANGALYAGDGELISQDVSRDVLNRHLNDPTVEFVHRGAPAQRPPSVVYGRVDRAVVPDSGELEPFVMLTYHLVFRSSGLPAGVDGLKGLLLSIVSPLTDWHQLDHYTAATIILSPSEQPIGMMLQQHNYTRTYLFGEQERLAPDQRVKIDIAERSNELYPHRGAVEWRRAVRFADAAGLRYLMGFGSKPLLAAADRTVPGDEVRYKLELLPHTDAFYQFAGYLGERRLLPGRSGPPGAAYNTLPRLKPYPRQLFVGYWREGHRGDWRRFQELVNNDGDLVAFADAQRRVFFRNLDCLRAQGRVCE